MKVNRQLTIIVIKKCTTDRQRASQELTVTGTTGTYSRKKVTQN